MEAPPIFVVGTARSGTTLLQAALGAHHRIAGPPEVHFILRIARLADYYGDLTDDANLRRAVHDTVDTPLLDPLDVDEHEVLRRAERVRTYAGLLDALMCTIAASWGKARWSEKTPGQPAHEVWGLFPEAQVIHIVRDPVAVISSHRRTPLRQQPVRVAATQWMAFNRATRQAGSQAGPDRYTMVRYETLVEQPEATLREVCSFIGEPFDPKMLTHRSESRAVTRDAWWQQGATGDIRPAASSSRDLGPIRRAVINAVARRDLPAFGYPRPHPLAVAAGRGLNAAARVVDRARRPSPAPTVLSPTERYELVQRQMAERVTALAGDARRSS